MNKKLLTIVFVSLAFGLFSCSEEDTYQSLLEDERNERLAFLREHNIGEDALISGGIYYQELLKGEGDTIKIGDNAAIFYTGYFLDGRVFDDNVLSGRYEPMTVRIEGPFSGSIIARGQRAGRLIQGWVPALLKMQAGTKSRIVVPSRMAYGIFGSGGVPGYTTLVFEIEVKDIKNN